MSQSAAFVWSIGIFGCLSAVSIDASFPAIPALIQDFQVSLQEGQQIVSLYLLGFALGQVPFGVLSDRFGRLPMVYLGIGGFFLATLGTLIATDMTQLGGARLIQGFMGASGSVLSQEVFLGMWPRGGELARLNAFVVVCLGVTMVAAPVLGSLLTHWLGWRGGFLPSLFLVLIAAELVRRFVPETKVTPRSDGSLLAQTLETGKMFFCSRRALWGAALIGATFFAYMALLAGLGQLLVGHYGLPKVMIGPFFSLAAICYCIAGSVGRHLLTQRSPVSVIRVGGLCYGVAIVVALLVMFTLPSNVYVFWLCLATFLVGVGLVLPSAMAVALTPFSRGVGLAASVLGTIQIALSAAGSFLVGMAFQYNPHGLFLVMGLGLLCSICLISLSRPILKHQSE